MRGLVIFTCDVISLILSFFLSWLFSLFVKEYILGGRFLDPDSAATFNRLIVFLCLGAILLAIIYHRGHYTQRMAWWTETQQILLTLTLIAIADGFLQYAFKYPFSRLWLFQGWLLAALMMIVFRTVARLVASALGVWDVPTVVVGHGENVVDTIYALHSEPYTGYRIEAVVRLGDDSAVGMGSLPKDLGNIHFHDGLPGLEAVIRENPNWFFVLAFDDLQATDVRTVIDDIVARGIAFAVVPPIKGLSLHGLDSQYFFGHDVMFLLPRNNLQRPLSRATKRAFDVVIASLLVVVLLPLFVGLGLLIKSGGGPVYYRHSRVGRNRKKFECLKFRTMVPNADKVLKDLLAADEKARAEWEKNFKLHEDPRITRVGRFLRRSSLDELPQLFNVLWGEMSLVGPRPIVEEEMERYRNDLKYYYSVRPGITGLWQISGRNDIDYDYRVRLDSWYVKNWSLWHDITILFRTVSVVLKRVGAY